MKKCVFKACKCGKYGVFATATLLQPHYCPYVSTTINCLCHESITFVHALVLDFTFVPIDEHTNSENWERLVEISNTIVQNDEA